LILHGSGKPIYPICYSITSSAVTNRNHAPRLALFLPAGLAHARRSKEWTDKIRRKVVERNIER
jgi:hypothetical protein